MKVKCVIYARVSGKAQETANQIDILTSWAEQKDFEVVEIYQEQESAWKSGHQKELARLKADVMRHRFEVVLVWALDRLSREGSAAILNLIDSLKAYGVRVLSYQESWTEAPGAIGEILYAIAGWVARMESERRSERTKAGLARAIKSGSKLGRPKGSKDKQKRRRTGYLLRYAK